jgi:hypothetical protein
VTQSHCVCFGWPVMLAGCNSFVVFSRCGRYTHTVRRELRYDMALAGLILQLIRSRALTPLWFEALRSITSRSATDPAYAFAAGGILPANRHCQHASSVAPWPTRSRGPGLARVPA